MGLLPLSLNAQHSTSYLQCISSMSPPLPHSFSLLSLSYCPLPPLLSVVTIQFDQTSYTPSEGETVMAVVQVVSGVMFDRDITVTVETSDGSAGMAHVV